MHMKSFGWILTIAAFAGTIAQANLVINGDFASGDLSSWTALNAVVTSDPANVYAGQYAAELDPVAGRLSQTVPIVGGQTYQLDFWAKASGVGTLTIGLDGLPSISLAFGDQLSSTYQEYDYILSPYAAGDLWFSWADESTHSAYLDDVSLVTVPRVFAVPEPSTLIAGASLLLPLMSISLGMLRRHQRAAIRLGNSAN
jgi:hypothetical protein